MVYATFGYDPITSNSSGIGCWVCSSFHRFEVLALINRCYRFSFGSLVRASIVPLDSHSELCGGVVFACVSQFPRHSQCSWAFVGSCLEELRLPVEAGRISSTGIFLLGTSWSGLFFGEND